MVPLSPRPLAVAVIVAWCGLAQAQSGAADAIGRTPALRVERVLGAGTVDPPAEGAAFARADRIRNENDERIVLDGTAEIRRGGVVLRGDRIVYTVATDQLQVCGSARFYADGAVFTGPRIDARLDAQTGTMPQARFTYAPRNASGSSELVEFLGDGRARMTDASFTTCDPNDPAWWIKANSLTLDRNEEEAIARGARLYFFDVPVMATPYLEFPIGNRRRSGLLTPSFGLNSRLGAEATVPYYWNIAPDRDATIAARAMQRRGLMLQNELRYLEPLHKGALRFDYLPRDRETDSNRSMVAARADYANPNGVLAGVNYNRVSDDQYFVDFGSNIVTASQSVLPQEAYLAYNQMNWNTALRITRNQTLQDPLAPVTPPYERVPQLTASAWKNDLSGFDFSVAAELTEFSHPTLQTGTRMIVAPVVSYPLLAPGYFVVPRLRWHATAYRLDGDKAPDTSPLRSLPLASLDAGLVFERSAPWFGEDTVQTLEPRLYYAYVPYRDQNDLPNFDSAEADFNFSQLFTENAFVGGDRIGQANQITTALVGRVLDPATGAERLRGAIGQRYYLSSQAVTLPGGKPRTGDASDLLASVAGLVRRYWIVDASVQHSTEEDKIVRAAVGVRYQPRPASALSVAYRYKIDDLEQFDVATQWPLTAQWYAVARANYSRPDRRFVEVVGGLEYKADCWTLRMAVQRYAAATEQTTTTFFFQVELNGLGSIGSNPTETLRRNIPGYQSIQPPPRQAGRYEYYE